MSRSRMVCVSYLERNKLFELPCSDSAGATTDLAVLDGEFRREFLIEDSDSHKHTVTFQKFDPEWNDLNPDAGLEHKDKLKAVVTTVLSSANAASASATGLPSPSSTSDDSDAEKSDQQSTPSLHKRKTCSTDTGDEAKESSSSMAVDSTPNRKKRKIQKTEDDNIPLQDPFPLPKFYRADVEAALHSKNMTKETRSQFLSSVASTMLNKKRYPTKEDYIIVARTITKTYPFMASPVGGPHGAIIKGLTDRFKNFRRTPKKRVTCTTTDKATTDSAAVKTPGRLPGITSSPSQPTIPPGEDLVSFERHSKALQSEYKKSKKNNQLVSDLMKRTFALRRQDILTNSYDLDTLFCKFPFLQDCDKLMQEMEMIAGKDGLRESAQQNWKNLVPKILQQATLEANNSVRVATALKRLRSTYDDRISALAVLPLMLPDVRIKADSDKVIGFVEDPDTSVDEAAHEKRQLEPYILFKPQDECDEHDDQICLVIDGQVVMNILVDDMPFILMAAYFAFNICYPRGTTNFFAFMEIVLLDFPSQRTSATVKNLLAALHTL